MITQNRKNIIKGKYVHEEKEVYKRRSKKYGLKIRAGKETKNNGKNLQKHFIPRFQNGRLH